MDPNEQPPEPTLPPAEQMRARRLAKLATAASQANTSTSPQPDESRPTPPAGSPKPSSSNDEKENAQARRKINITSSPALKTEPTHTAAAAAAAAAAPSKPITIHPAPQTAATSTTSTPPPAKRPQTNESLEDWTDDALSAIFRVTVDNSRQQDRYGHQLAFLSNLSDELHERGQPLKLTLEDLDPAINEAGTVFTQHKSLMDYFLPCWKTVVKLDKQLRDRRPAKVQALQEAKRLCMSNCIFALTLPEYFGREPNPAHQSITPYLLRGLTRDDGICLDFISEAVSRFADDEDGQVAGIFVQAMLEISNRLATMTMNDDYLPYVEVLVMYSKFKPLLEAIANHAQFQMATSAPNIEKMTILGPFFRLSPLQGEVAKQYFVGARTLDPSRIKQTQTALQMTLTTHQDNLHGIAMAFARAGDVTKNKLLDWFAYIMNTNHKRRAIQVNNKEVASNGFMMNITAVLDRMCEPFMDSQFSKIDKIDIDYLRRKPRIDISDETKLNADQAQSDAFYGNPAPGTTNFVSELFFQNLAAHHYGSGAAGQKLKDLDREIKHMEKQLAILEDQKRKAASNPMTLAVVERHLKTYTDALEKHIAHKHALEAVLIDPKMQERSLTFMRYVTVWLLRVASRTPYLPDKRLVLPLPSDRLEAFSCLPEYVLQNVLDNFKFVFRTVPQILLSAVGDEMIALCITFLESSEYIKNPYLKSSLITLLFSGTWRIYHRANGVLGDALTTTKFANKYLLHALMKFYIECELHGGHNQFYDKFNTRYEIFQVIKCVWPNDIYKQQLTEESRLNTNFFVQFVNLLLNDATFVLDEALTRFPKIHELQKELEENNQLTQEARQEKESELQSTEGHASSYMQLANETIAMMKLFTDALGDAFTMPEIVSRLAGMLDYNLVTLAGPKSNNLKVKDPRKYNFDPRTLLPQLVDLYLNLGSKPSFIEAVASDGRSYKPEVFNNASRILATKCPIEPSKLDAWHKLNAEFVKAKQIADQAELDYGDIPDEFEDPLLGDIMKDPVMLPSTNIVDRSTIVQHLLSDPTDPFTRSRMTIDDVVPATDLKQRIDAWKLERVAAAKAKVESAMDTAE